MMGIFLAAALLLLMLWLLGKQQHPSSHPKPSRKKTSFLDWLLTGGLAIFMLLVFRIGWVQAFARLQYLIYMLLPFLRSGGSAHAAGNASSAANDSAPLSRKEAAMILGVEETASEVEIQRAYKQLMLKLHPDAGGNSYLAGKLNAARDCLLHKD